MRRIFQRSLKFTSATRSASNSQASAAVRSLRRPAIALAFLLAIVMSAFAVRSGQTLLSESADHSPEAAVDSQTGATEQNKVESDNSGSESTGGEAKASVGESGNSITTRTTVENGQASVQMEVNGEEVPVSQNGASHHTITTDNGQTTIDVNVQNGQNGQNGYSSSFSSTNSTSSSTTVNGTSFQSQSVWVSH